MKRRKSSSKYHPSPKPTLAENPLSITIHTSEVIPKSGLCSVSYTAPTLVIRAFMASTCLILNRQFGLGKSKLDAYCKDFNQFWTEENRDNNTIIEYLDAWLIKKGVDL